MDEGTKGKVVKVDLRYDGDIHTLKLRFTCQLKSDTIKYVEVIGYAP